MRVAIGVSADRISVLALLGPRRLISLRAYPRPSGLRRILMTPERSETAARRERGVVAASGLWQLAAGEMGRCAGPRRWRAPRSPARSPVPRVERRSAAAGRRIRRAASFDEL